VSDVHVARRQLYETLFSHVAKYMYPCRTTSLTVGSTVSTSLTICIHVVRHRELYEALFVHVTYYVYPHRTTLLATTR
jgi:hypothetical protein